MSRDMAGKATETRFKEPTKLLTPNELAEILTVPVATLYAWRYHGRGPIAVRVGRHLRYRQEDVDTWLDDNRREARSGL